MLLLIVLTELHQIENYSGGGDGGNDSSLGKEQFGGNDSVGGISTGGMFNTVEYDNGTHFNIYALFLLSTFISHAHYISHYETSCLVF